MRLSLHPLDITSEASLGLEVSVDGYKGDMAGVKPSQVWIEVHEGKLHITIWDGSSEDPSHEVWIDKD